MPRFGIKTQVTLLSLGLLALPLVGLNYWGDIQKTALTAQARIQEVEARAIATSLLATQNNIRELLAADQDSELYKHSLSAPHINDTIVLDGDLRDWPLDINPPAQFGANNITWEAPKGASQALKTFELSLAQSAKYLYLAIAIDDPYIIFKKTTQLRLDYNDHIQLTYLDASQQLRRIIIPSVQEGSLSTYYTDHTWQYGQDQIVGREEQITPSHKTNIQGYWKKTEMGYAVELRIPTAQLDTLQPQLHVAVVDFDNLEGFGPQKIISTLPSGFDNKLNPLGIHAREFQRVIDQLKHTYARLWIYDRRGREWAFTERESSPAADRAESAFNSRCVQDALQGKVEPLQHLKGKDGTLGRLVVCYPIMDEGETLGVVVVDEAASHILDQEETRVRDIAAKMGGIIAFMLLVLFAYAVTLVRRISKLSEQSRTCIDSHGRIENTRIQASKNFPDELGDLSRSMTNLLERQQSYVDFLERIPQTLRHEISNPLNKLRTSLENLIDEAPELSKNKYIKKIDSGIDQISRITLELTEAASLESALQNEHLIDLDLSEFVNGYFGNYLPEIHFEQTDQSSAFMQGDASRLEQLFDKLMENAFSFCPAGGEIKVHVSKNNKLFNVLIENDGPMLPSESMAELSAPMISTRSSGSSIHLGLGLHIAKLIADQHKATLNGKNRADGSGVIFEVRFPLMN